MRQPRHNRRSEQGAAAVEFALVMPILLLLVFGIIDYGALYADSVSARNGVREAARQGVVSNFGASGNLAGVASEAVNNTQSISGTTTAVAFAPGGWVKGQPLIVCAQISDPKIIGFVPLPNQIRAQAELSIESASSPPSGSIATTAGAWSSWCN